VIEISAVSKSYGSGRSAVTVLDRVSLTVERGEIAAVVGPSGAGKSTLAHCINLLVTPTSGQILVGGEDLTRLTGAALRTARRSIGTVFQGSSLLRRRTAAQNIALPLEYFGVTRAGQRARVGELLDMVGLADRADAYPSELSGGQRQRIGIARALALRPSVLLADEATSGLDPATTASILGLFKRIRDEFDLSIVLITHEMDVVRETADTVARLEGGRIVEAGSIADVLTNPASSLARELIPDRAHLAPASGETAWELVYSSAQVRSDWLLDVSDALNTRVGLLSATIEQVDGTGVGRLVVSIDSGVADAAVRDALSGAGLSGNPLGTHKRERSAA
jgi:D-methionine transport system ATP-binding protein